MSSLRLRSFDLAVRLLIRRRDWGPSPQLARRARRLFGAPWPFQWLRSFGVEIPPANAADPAGEWLIPRTAAGPTVRAHSALQAAGSSSELVVYNDVFHGWQMLDGLVPESRSSLERAGRFVRSVAQSGL